MNNIIPWQYTNELEMSEEEYRFVRHLRRLRAQDKGDIITEIMNQIESKE